MKKKLWKRIAAIAAAGMMVMSTMSAYAAGEKTITADHITTADTAYYQGLINPENPTAAPIQSQIKITKKASNVDAGDFADGDEGIAGVKFGIKKIGDIAQIEDGTTTVMVYGIDKTLADKIGLNADYVCGDKVYVKDYATINTALRTKLDDELVEDVNIPHAITDAEGVADFGAREFGLYLVVETDISNATINGKPITITRKQYPYAISAPYYVDEETGWVADVSARAKNDQGFADFEKKIVRGFDGTKVGTIADENLKDTDVTEVGDVVEFKLTSTLPDMRKSAVSAKVDKFIISDNCSKGLTLPEFSANNMVVVDSTGIDYTFGTDYTVVKSVITDGEAFTVTFTEAGRTKLTKLAKENEAGQVHVYYTATVNTDAVVGEAGNPNEARLEYSVGGGNTVVTEWDEVKEYIFDMYVTKTFNEKVATADQAEDVTFKLYSMNGDEKVYAKVTGTDGTYVYDKEGTAAGATDVLKLTADGKLSIKGLSTNTTWYLEETATKSGFNILKKPVELILVPVSDANNEYNGTLNQEDTKVNNTTATLTDTKAGITFTVNNTSGFLLPATGGMGAWLFAISGVLVIAAGAVFFVATRKKRA